VLEKETDGIDKALSALDCVLLCLSRKFRPAGSHPSFYDKTIPAVISCAVETLEDQQTMLDRPLAHLGAKRRVALSLPFTVPAILAIAQTDLILQLAPHAGWFSVWL
jgi:hypothetical protein